MESKIYLGFGDIGSLVAGDEGVCVRDRLRKG